MQNLLLNLQLKGFNFVMGDDKSTGWAKFQSTVNSFFNGDSNSLRAVLPTIGTAILLIGLVMAVVSFAVHHFNQQSRLPSWIICLTIAIVGGLLISPSGDITFITNFAGWIQSLVS